MSKALNFVAFQAGWFACILGAAEGLPWLGPVVVTVCVGAALSTRSDRVPFALRMTAAAGLGFLADTILLRIGVLQFGAGVVVSPVWMTALWPNLAATLDSSLGWLSGRYILAAAVGALGGPAAYYAGARLGALRLDPTPTTLGAIAFEWLATLPLLLLMTDRSKGAPA